MINNWTYQFHLPSERNARHSNFQMLDLWHKKPQNTPANALLWHLYRFLTAHSIDLVGISRRAMT
ncbi:hypothetical protein Plhal304r1_c014g0053421 [Plasmopara halstedii]